MFCLNSFLSRFVAFCIKVEFHHGVTIMGDPSPFVFYFYPTEGSIYHFLLGTVISKMWSEGNFRRDAMHRAELLSACKQKNHLVYPQSIGLTVKRSVTQNPERWQITCNLLETQIRISLAQKGSITTSSRKLDFSHT